MDLDTFQAKVRETAAYPSEASVVYPVLGLAGEAGEVAEKVRAALFPAGPPTDWSDISCLLKELYRSLTEAMNAGRQCEHLKKRLRDRTDKLPRGFLDALAGLVSQISEDAKVGILKEVGDVCWYGPSVIHDVGSTLEKVCQELLDKLASRKARGVIGGSGDNR
jgi:NTP pyrophosphatase (non-canonical NTP hydrolase)